MGGSNSVLKKPLGSTGDKALGKNNFFTNAANMAVSSAMTGGVSQTFDDRNPISIGNTMRNIGEGLGEITGSNALRKQAMDQQQANEEEAKRQAMVSDAMARSQGGDATNIFLATGKRGKGGKGGSTGSAGTGSSRETGVQS